MKTATLGDWLYIALFTAMIAFAVWMYTSGRAIPKNNREHQ